MRKWGPFRSVLMVAIMLCAVYMAALQGDIVDGVRAGLGFRRSGIDQRLSGHRDFAVVSNESADDDTFPRRDVNDVSYGPITVEQLDLPSSSFTCDDKEELYQTCIFENLVLHQGWLYYVVDHQNDVETIQWPNPTLFEVGNSDVVSFTIKERVHAISRTALQKLLRKEVKRAKSDGQLQLKEFTYAILHRSRTYGHLFWGVNGANNIFIRLCKYLYVCSPEEIQGAAVLGPNLFPIVPYLRIGLGKHIKAVGDVMSCFGPVVGINHPDSAWDRSQPDVRLMTFKKVLAGIGEEVNEPLSAKGPNLEIRYSKPNASLALMRTQYLRQCAGLPATATPLKEVSVLLVNRPHGGGRHIIGLDDVYDKLLRELPGNVKVRLYYPRSENISDQASVFSTANIVLVPHGAANTNFAFLPQTAIIFAVYAVKDRHALDLDHAQALPTPPYNITVIPVNCSNSTQVNIQAVQKLKSFAKLDERTKAYLLGDPSINADKVKVLRAQLGFTSKSWMEFVDYVPDTDALAAAVGQTALQLQRDLNVFRFL